jgi:adenosine kinase
MKQCGIRLDHVSVFEDLFTPQCFITTDLDNNQITAFHPGAMLNSHEHHVRDVEGVTFGIVAPDGRDGMIQHAAQFKARNVPFIFDPGQGLPMFDGEDLKRFISQATWVAVNDYEGKMLADRAGQSLAEISRQPHLRGLIETLGAEGSNVWVQGTATHVPGLKVDKVIDPTGCGDAFRGGVLYGLSQGWDLVRSVRLGNQMGAAKIATPGPQTYTIDRQALLAQA